MHSNFGNLALKSAVVGGILLYACSAAAAKTLPVERHGPASSVHSNERVTEKMLSGEYLKVAILAVYFCGPNCDGYLKDDEVDPENQGG